MLLRVSTSPVVAVESFSESCAHECYQNINNPHPASLLEHPSIISSRRFLSAPKKMGQYWRIALPHDSADFEYIGKLEEALFDESPGSIAANLAIPVMDWIDNTCDYQSLPQEEK
jgi:hypothetical protein